jgi:hypothetical protein
LIIWNDFEKDIEVAFSFQTIEGSSIIWDKIRVYQGKEPNSKILINESNKNSNKDSEEVSEENSDTDDFIKEFELPSPEIPNIEEIFLSLKNNFIKSELVREILKEVSFQIKIELFGKFIIIV